MEAPDRDTPMGGEEKEESVESPGQRHSELSSVSPLSKSSKRDSSMIQIEAKAYVEKPQQKKSIIEIFKGKSECNEEWKKKLRRKMDGVPFTLASIIFTLMILYADLIRVAVAPSNLDPFFLAFVITAVVIFAVEITLSSLCRPGYFFRFYFWMDLVASFSLLCDIPAFVDLITIDSDDSNRHLTLERMAKAAQAGARAARIMQVISVLQLLRLRAKRLRLRTNRASDLRLSRSTSESESENGAMQFQMTTLKPQTRVGEKLTEMTMRKVILGVLILLSVLPVFDSWVFYGSATSFEEGGVVTLHNLFANEGNSSAFQSALTDYKHENEYKVGGRTTGRLIKLVVHNITFFESERFNDLRRTEKQSTSVQVADIDGIAANITEAWIDVRWDVQFQALLDIARITFLLMVLSLGAVFFIRDADSLVLQPIERMVQQVKQMSENPLSSLKIDVNKDEKQKSKQLETRVLERSIGKVCNLLSVGFGEAGAEIIANNIKSGGDINPMLPGRRVRAIFGFCDIRNFTSATEVLQEDIMEFVNCIASIVHAEVSFHGGAPNKNIGDAFLVVWKLPECQEKYKRSRGSIIEAKAAMLWGGDQDPDIQLQITQHLADAALASMIIIKSALDRSSKLKKFCDREDMQEKIPGFRASMGFGLHVGWAIEGAIGSHHKIDPSYLSPHVNMAARLEAATKQYHVPILLSDSFYSLLSPQNQERCRAIDTVLVKGSFIPTTLYTIKVDFREETSHRGPDCSQGRRSSFNSEQNGHESGGHLSFSDYPYLDEFDEHPDIASVPWISSPDGIELLDTFHEAYTLYIQGRWRQSMGILERLKDLGDGPSMALLAFMQSQGGIPPATWEGCRELTEK
mmetsp:Transcript_4391/g.8730  ORF Transcript_4391/g.8730 Transcript_4391/m.8730 type:complete len:860 (-) Transcript_4391:18-2597(-)